MSAEDRRAILRILVNMGNLSNGPVNARVNELIQKLRGAINLTRRIIDALATTTTDNTGTEAQLNLLLEIKVLLKFGKKRAVWFYGRLPAIYSALEIYKSRQYQADTSNNVIPNDRYQVAARARTAVLWIDDLTKDLNHILVAVRNNNVRSLQAVSGLSEGPLWKLRDIKTVLLLLLHEVNSEYISSRYQGALCLTVNRAGNE